MVVFTCSYCGDSVKKNQVEKHYLFKCRNREPALTCVDCLKDFIGNEHVAHTTCVTEAERYSAKGFVVKAPSDKGKRKQEAWVNFIRAILDKDIKLNRNIKDLLVAVSKDGNVPQKKMKFLNYCKSKFRLVHPSEVEQAWNFLVEKKQEFAKSSTPGQEDNKSSEVNSSQEDRKRKRIDSSNDFPKEAENKICDITKSNSESVDKKKKKKQDKNSEESLEVQGDDANEKECESVKNIQNDCVNITAPHVDLENENNCQEVNEDEIDGTDSTPSELPDHLSKKDKKKIRKREKYQKQLLEIQNQSIHNLSNENVDHDSEAPVKSKKKKKNFQGNGIVDNLQDNEKTVNKKKLQQVSGNDIVENAQNGIEEDVDVKQTKFNWEETVLKVLASKGELPLKRVEKKVVNEFMNTGAHIESVEKVIAKFNKKILKMSSVKVKKDIVKLVSL